MSAVRREVWEWSNEPPVRLGQFDHRGLQRENNSYAARIVNLPETRLPSGEFTHPITGEWQEMTLADYYGLLRSLGRW